MKNNGIWIGVSCVISIWQTLVGAEYHVSTVGLDSNPGTTALPWRTIQKAANSVRAGDRVVVASGSYGERVSMRFGGQSVSPVSLIADGEVKTSGIRLQAPHLVVEGFTLTGEQHGWQAHLEIDAVAHHCEIRHCRFGPGVYAMADDFVWNAATGSVSSSSVDFVSAGFKVGGDCFFGASGMDGLWFDNHDSTHVISSVEPTKLTFSTSLLPETKNPAWAPIFAGSNRNGIAGIKFITSGGESASACRISNCRFEDLFGMSIDVRGDGHEISNNVFTDTNSYYAVRPNGSNLNIHHNLFIDCSNFLFYTQSEVAGIPHPLGSDWFDFQVGFIHSANGGSNVRFHHNWMENVEYRMGQISENPGVSGYLVEHNVFVGIAAAFNGGRDNTEFRNNTFYRVGFDYPTSNALAVGGNTAEIPQDGLVINRNVFVDCGSHWKSKEGSYQVTEHVTNSIVDENFIAQYETSGYAPQEDRTEPNGVNGGDPMFVDQENPRGPDGIPFTEDDGLRPMPNSPIAMNNWGALPPVEIVEGEPIAHFRVTALSSGLGWKDQSRHDFDPAWVMLLPYERTARIRPYRTSEALGEPGVIVTFSASGSIGGLSSDSVDATGITSFRWDFGDGVKVTTESPEVEHAFARSGKHGVALTVTNSLGGTHTVQKTYRVLGDQFGSNPMAPTGFGILAQ